MEGALTGGGVVGAVCVRRGVGVCGGGWGGVRWVWCVPGVWGGVGWGAVMGGCVFIKGGCLKVKSVWKEHLQVGVFWGKGGLVCWGCRAEGLYWLGGTRQRWALFCRGSDCECPGASASLTPTYLVGSHISFTSRFLRRLYVDTY